MQVKFKRRHRFFQIGEVRDVPDHIGLKLAQSGIVNIMDEGKKLDESPIPEDKAVKGSVSASSTRRKKKRGSR